MKKKLKVIIPILIFSCALFAEASFVPSEWQFKRSLSVPKGEDFVKIVLPSDISSASVNFKDIRIVDQNTGEAPYLISRGVSQKGGVVRATILDKTTKGSTTEFIVDAGSDGVVHSRLDIDSNSKNFKRQVSVYASHTALPVSSGSWALVTKDGYIFKFTDSVTGSTYGKNDVSFSQNSSRYFKVVISEGSEGAVDVLGATLYGDFSISNPVYTKNVSTSVFNNPDKRTTEVSIDLGKEGFLTHSVTLQTNSKNFSRKVIVESSSDQTNWKVVSQGYISNVSTPLFEGSSTKLNYTEQTARYLRLSIINDDNKPISIEGSATVEGPVISAIFKAEPSSDYTLYYGNRNATSPQYDISRISSYIEENKIPTAIVGEEVVNPDYVTPEGPVVPLTERYKFLLNIVLAVVVVVLGGGIAMYLRKFAKEKNANIGDGFEK